MGEQDCNIITDIYDILRSMNTSSYILRKKISLYSKLLAGVLFVGLGFYAVTPIIKPPLFFYALFPVCIWENVAVVKGGNDIDIASIGLLMVLTIPLFIWGYGYPEKKHYGKRMKIWLILFIALIAYSLIEAAYIHIAAFFASRELAARPAGEYPVPPQSYTSFDALASVKAFTPPLFSWLFVVFMVAVCVYTTVSIRILYFIRRADKTEALEQDAENLLKA